MISAAASSIRAEVFGLVAEVVDDPGFKGNGGGARSGSLLSHLENPTLIVSIQIPKTWVRVLMTPYVHRNRSSTRIRKGMLMLKHKRVRPVAG